MPNFLGVETKEIRKLIQFNYPLIILTGLVIVIFSQIYKIVPLGIVLATVGANLLATVIVHYISVTKAKPWIQTASLTLLSIVIISTIAYGITFFNVEMRPVALLILIPAIVMQSSLSRAFGILAIGLVSIAVLSLYLLQIRTDTGAGFIFVYFFLLMLGFLANHTMEILRRKEQEIEKIAKENAALYQMSKTTSDEIIKDMNEALVVLDEELNVSRHNEAFLKMAGGKGSLIGQNPAAFFNSISLPIQSLAQEIIENKISETVTFSTKDRSNNEYESTISRLDLKDGKEGFLVIMSKRQSPWGRVYDSKSGEPISLAIVRLSKADVHNNVVETKVTNDKGNFGFMVPEGEYRLSISKTGYIFPSKIKKDSYNGDNFHLSTNLVNFDIALDRE